MSQLKALTKLYVGSNKLPSTDVDFIIESFPQLTELGLQSLGLRLTGGDENRGFLYYNSSRSWLAAPSAIERTWKRAGTGLGSPAGHTRLHRARLQVAGRWCLGRQRGSAPSRHQRIGWALSTERGRSGNMQNSE